MSSRRCFAFASAALGAAIAAALIAGSAAAQTPQEMIGAYPMTVVSKFGPCDTTPTFEVEVRGFEGDRISLMLGGQPYSAPFDAGARRFHLETQDNDMGFRATMDGTFSREPQAVRLEADATWAVGCGGHISGSHLAADTGTTGTGTGTGTETDPGTDPGTGDGGQPTITITEGPPDTYTYGGASTPQPSAAACPPTGMNLWLCLSLALIMFLLGLAVGWLLFHEREEKRERKRKADADEPPDNPSEESS